MSNLIEQALEYQDICKDVLKHIENDKYVHNPKHLLDLEKRLKPFFNNSGDNVKTSYIYVGLLHAGLRNMGFELSYFKTMDTIDYLSDVVKMKNPDDLIRITFNTNLIKRNISL